MARSIANMRKERDVLRAFLASLSGYLPQKETGKDVDKDLDKAIRRINKCVEVSAARYQSLDKAIAKRQKDADDRAKAALSRIAENRGISVEALEQALEALATN